MNDRIPRRTGIAAIVAGLGFFAGQAGELVFGSPSDAVLAVFVVFGGIGLAAFGVALWVLRGALAEPRRVRIGLRIALVGAVLLGLFSVQAVVEVVRTGEVPENFALFGLGFLLAMLANSSSRRGFGQSSALPGSCRSSAPSARSSRWRPLVRSTTSACSCSREPGSLLGRRCSRGGLACAPPSHSR